MILEKQTNAVVLQEGESNGSIGMSLDMDSAQVLMEMLSKNLYSDAIGSTIREWSSNALDSHRRIGADNPIIVSFKPNDSGQYEFCVEDFGIGMDDSDVTNIISKYGKSTKRTSATELGMFGLGFKAGLAYSSSFYFVCRKNGVERKYMMYEGEDVNTIDLLYEKPTSEKNGVKMILPVHYSDRNEFREKIAEQLAYFENVYFDCEGYIDNNFKIYRSETFQFSSLAKDNKLHLCLDNVYYPLDFSKLGIDQIYFPVALRFNLTDGLFPIPSRESIKYTKEGKDAIMKKIGQLADYFMNIYNSSITESDDVYKVFKHFSSNDMPVTIFDDQESGIYRSGEVSYLKPYTTISPVSPKLKGINILNLELLHRNKDYIFGEYECKYRITGYSRTVLSECKNWYDKDIKVMRLPGKSVFIYTDKLGGHKKDYLKFKYKDGIIIKKVKEFTLGGKKHNADYTTYYDILGLGAIPKQQWRDAIKEFQSILTFLMKDFVDLDKFVVPQDFIDSKKKQRVMVGKGGLGQKLEGEISVKRAENLERFVDGKNCKWVPARIKLQDIHKTKSLIVYSFPDKVDLMDRLFSTKQNITLIQLSEREFKNVKDLNIHNFISIDKFMKGDNMPFKRIATSYLIHMLMEQYPDTFQRKESLKKISEDLYGKLHELSVYEDAYFKMGNSEIYKAILEIAEQNSLFDNNIYHIYKEVKDILDKYSFINIILKSLPRWGSSENHPMMTIMVDMFKYNKKRIDYKNYVKLNVDTTEELNERSIEELIEEGE